MGLGKVSGRLGRTLLRLGLALVILLAAYVTAGRLLAPLAGSQKGAVEAALGAALDTPVRIGELKGDWWRFSPHVELRDVVIMFPARQGPGLFDAHVLEELTLRLDVPRSLLRGQWVVQDLALTSLALELEEGADGRWSLAGFGGGAGDHMDTILDVLLNTANLRVRDAELTLRPHDAPVLRLSDGSLRVKNRGARHQVELQAAMRERPVRLVLESRGDPRGDFDGRGFASLAGADLGPLLGLLPLEQWRPERLAGSARLWFNFDRQGLHEVHARVANLLLEGDIGERRLALSGGRGAFSAQAGDDQWRFWTRGLAFDWRGRHWRPADLYMTLEGPFSERTITLAAEWIDLAETRDMLLLAGVMPARAGEALTTLAPTGRLANVNLRGRLEEGRPRDFNLQANLEDVAVQAWKAAPSGRGIDGYLQADMDGGLVELAGDDFEMHLPRLFEAPWRYEDVDSRVQWRIGDGEVLVSSNVIEARNEQVHGRVQFELLNRRTEEGPWQSDLTLLVGASRMDAAAKSAYLPRLPKLRETMSWLDQAIVSGRLVDSGFVFRGRVDKRRPPDSSTVLGFYQFEDLTLNYQAGWPVLENSSGYVRHDNREAEIYTRRASLAGIELAPATADLRPGPDGEGHRLRVEGAAATSAEHGLSFLRDSPLRQTFGPLLEDWRAEGDIDVQVALDLPLRAGDAGAEPRVVVDVDSHRGRLTIPDHDLLFEEVRGRVRYDSAEGLSAEALDARLFGFPVTLDIASFTEEANDNDADGQRGTHIQGHGSATREALQSWSGLPQGVSALLDFTRGTVDYRADLRLFREAGDDGIRSRLGLVSDLRGLAVDLPSPFGKPAGERRELSVQMDLPAQRDGLTVRLGDSFFGRLHLDQEGLSRGLVHFGEQNRNFTVRQSDDDAPGLLVTGSLPEFDLDAWRGVLTTASTRPTGPGGLGGTLRLLDVDIERLRLGSLTLEDVNAQVRPADEAWDIFLDNALVRGHFELPWRAERPYRVQLEYLRLPGGEESEAGPGRDPLAGIDPSALPPLRFHTDEFSVGEKNLGAWAFDLQPHSGGARIRGLTVTMNDARIGGVDQQAGAELDWRHQQGDPVSAFSGAFEAGDLSRVLPSLGYGTHLVSESARVQGKLSWPGSPAAFAIAAASGAISLDIRKGRFVDVDSGTSRLFGALSLDSVVRRLQLDFSDLYQRGFAYDTIGGRLRLDAGVISTNDQLRIEGPSSKISLDGRLDLVNETVRADMLVNVPISQNISVLAGILGAWPIAVSTYVAGRIFEDQVNDFTSVAYRLEGPWDSLNAGFEAPRTVSPRRPSAQRQ